MDNYNKTASAATIVGIIDGQIVNSTENICNHTQYESQSHGLHSTRRHDREYNDRFKYMRQFNLNSGGLLCTMELNMAQIE